MKDSKNRYLRLCLFFSLTYMVSYVSRINFGAVISEMELRTGFSRQALSISLVGSFITYGLGQICSGILGDKVSPRKLLILGLGVTGCMNLLLPLCRSPFRMSIVWSVNGFAQSFMWPPLVKLMVLALTQDEYKKAVVVVSCGSSIGTILVYLLSPVLITCFGWKAVFCFGALAAFLLLPLWFFFPLTGAEERQETEKTKGAFFTPLMGLVMGCIVLQGMLRDGVTTWMPTYVGQVLHLPNTGAILSGTILPLFGMLCYQAALWLYRKKVSNPLTCAGLIFSLGFFSALLLTFFPGSVVSLALLTGCMHGVNLMLICMLPPFFASGNRVSTVSGLLNACTYLGSALSTYGFAYFSELYGWDFTVLSWVGIALLGSILCFVGAGAIKKKLV